MVSGTRVRGFKPSRSRRIFRAKKILSTPSFGGQVKPSVPCRKFTACKRTQKSDVEVSTFGKILGNFSPIVPPFAVGVRSRLFRRGGRGGSWNVLITGPPGWGFDVPLATALCKKLPAENTQRYLSRPKPTRVTVPIEVEEEGGGGGGKEEEEEEDTSVT